MGIQPPPVPDWSKRSVRARIGVATLCILSATIGALFGTFMVTLVFSYALVQLPVIRDTVAMVLVITEIQRRDRPSSF